MIQNDEIQLTSFVHSFTGMEGKTVLNLSDDIFFIVFRLVARQISWRAIRSARRCGLSWTMRTGSSGAGRSGQHSSRS
jgi:hypothetical protein